ncbi:MAG TPA: hypothetical protein VL899_10140 [Alphaproteobacteria bacterium]|nr:hypothetical protein [Alphaproteobacteria bacterium]
MSDQIVIPPGHNPVEGNSANLIYILYLASFVVGVTSLIGIVMAYVYKDAAPAWVQTHYRFQIRTFWIGLLFGVIGGVTAFIGIGFLILLFTAIWYIVRCVKGMQAIGQGQAVANVETWMW